MDTKVFTVVYELKDGQIEKELVVADNEDEAMEMFWYQTEAMIQNDVLDSYITNIGTLPLKEAERYQHYVEYEDGFASYSDYLKRKDKKR